MSWLHLVLPTRGLLRHQGEHRKEWERLGGGGGCSRVRRKCRGHRWNILREGWGEVLGCCRWRRQGCQIWKKWCRGQWGSCWRQCGSVGLHLPFLRGRWTCRSSKSRQHQSGSLELVASCTLKRVILNFLRFQIVGLGCLILHLHWKPLGKWSWIWCRSV